MDKADCKEFTTVFNEPICKGDDGRGYTLVYEVEEPERYFENAFLIDSQKFTLSFKYPLNTGINRPILYEISQETEEKKQSSLSPVIEQDKNYELVRWEISNITKGQTFRIEW